MKKFAKMSLVAAIAAIGFTTAASAQTDIHVGTSKVEIAGESATEISIGFGFDNRDSNKTNGFYWGTSFDLGQASIDSEDYLGFSADLKLGYMPIENLAVYGVGSALVQSADNFDSYGFGYGAGIDYKFHENVSASIEYKTYTMTPDINGYAGPEYDFDKIGFNIKYLF